MSFFLSFYVYLPLLMASLDWFMIGKLNLFFNKTHASVHYIHFPSVYVNQQSIYHRSAVYSCALSVGEQQVAVWSNS